MHTHVGKFPTSFRSKTENSHITPESTVAYLRENNITHHLTLYPRDEYYLMEELQALAPEITHYGVQVVMGKDPEHADYIENFVPDYGDPNKPLCVGVKIASHRGYWKRKTKEFVQISSLSSEKFYKPEIVEKIESGCDYGVYAQQIKKYVLDRLKPNAIVSMHMQGDPIKNSGSNPQHQAVLAYAYPWLKFINNHTGDFGPPNLAGKHGRHIYIKKTRDDVNTFPAFRHAHSLQIVKQSIEFSRWLPNIMLDTSIFLSHKAELLVDHKRWCVCSDWPAGTGITQVGEEKKFIKVLGQERIDQMYKDAYEWFHKDWKDIYLEHVEEHDFRDESETVLELLKEKLSHWEE